MEISTTDVGEPTAGTADRDALSIRLYIVRMPSVFEHSRVTIPSVNDCKFDYVAFVCHARGEIITVSTYYEIVTCCRANEAMLAGWFPAFLPIAGFSELEAVTLALQIWATKATRYMVSITALVTASHLVKQIELNTVC